MAHSCICPFHITYLGDVVTVRWNIDKILTITKYFYYISYNFFSIASNHNYGLLCDRGKNDASKKVLKSFTVENHKLQNCKHCKNWTSNPNRASRKLKVPLKGLDV